MPKLFEVESKTITTVHYDGHEYLDIPAAQAAALAKTLGCLLDQAKVIIANKESVLEILAIGEEAPKPALKYSDDEYAAANKDSGIPVKILKSRVSQGHTLNAAKTTPYTPRPRKTSQPSPEAVNAALQDQDQ